MILFVAVVWGVLAGLAAGGRLGRLGETRLRGSAVLAVALVVHLVVGALSDRAPQLTWMVLPAWTLSLTVVLAVSIGNMRSVGFPAIVVGAVLNLVVVMANSGMPVSATAAQVSTGGGSRVLTALSVPDGLHVLLEAGSRLALLADVAVVPLGGLSGMAVSVGDMLLAVGVITYTVHGMTRGGTHN